MVLLDNRRLCSYRAPDGYVSVRYETEGTGSRRRHPGDIIKTLNIYRDGTHQETIGVPFCTDDDLTHLESLLAHIATDRPTIDEFCNDLYLTVERLGIE